MMFHIPYARGMQTSYMNVENAVFMRIWMRERTTSREHSQRKKANESEEDGARGGNSCPLLLFWGRANI